MCWEGGRLPQEKSTSGQAQAIVGRDVAVLPRHRLQACQHGVALLSRRHQDGGSGRALGQRLGRGLLDSRTSSIVGTGRGPFVEPLGRGLLDFGRLLGGGCWRRRATTRGGEGGYEILVGAKIVIHRGWWMLVFMEPSWKQASTWFRAGRSRHVLAPLHQPPSRCNHFSR